MQSVSSHVPIIDCCNIAQNIDIREDVGPRIKRDNYMKVITNNDLRNAQVIVRDRTVIRHSDDVKSVQLAVSEFQMEAYNSVLPTRCKE